MSTGKVGWCAVTAGGAGSGPGAGGPPGGPQEKTCPECGSSVPIAARKCRHCQFLFNRRRRLSPATFLGAVALLVIGAVASLLLPKAWDALTQKPSSTEVSIMRPWKFGVLDPGIKITETRSASCSPSFISNAPGALRCYTSDDETLVLDVCWPNDGEPAQAVCLGDPWNNEGILANPISVEDDADAEKELDLAPATPWALELANGSKCVLVPGATGIIAGMRLNYSCGGEDAWVVGDVDNRQKLWMALFSPKDSNEVSQVSVTRAWL